MAKLIILYGDLGSTTNGKYQALIEGRLTCGYREYARCSGGYIVYMSPQQNLHQPWEKNILSPDAVRAFCDAHPDAIVWSVKHGPDKNKKILKYLRNFKIHYPCNSQHPTNPYCDISIVDTEARVINDKTKLFFKGKDPEFWKPVSPKEYDYLLMGRLNNKNQTVFLTRLNEVRERRRVLWIGGAAFQKKVKTHHDVVYTKPSSPDFVRDNISKARVGILYSEIATEGFPQSFLEMTMCGVPVVYHGPVNRFYFFPENSVRPPKKKLVSAAEDLLRNHDSVACRKIAVERYSIQRSIEHLYSLSGK